MVRTDDRNLKTMGLIIIQESHCMDFEQVLATQLLCNVAVSVEACALLSFGCLNKRATVKGSFIVLFQGIDK